MQDLQEKVGDVKFISLSLDVSPLVAIQKISQICNAENLCSLIVSCLKDIIGMDNYDIAMKLICVGVNGVM